MGTGRTEGSVSSRVSNAKSDSDKHLHICDGNRQVSYTVRMELDQLAGEATSLVTQLAGRRALVVTTPTVMELYGEAVMTQLRRGGAEVSVFVSACTEADKSVERALDVCREALRVCLDRRGVIIGFGGGVCLDVSKVAAGWFLRGVAFIAVPTTLIGQCDAGIGVKGSLNFNKRKSSLGCFRPPEAVLLDPRFLRTVHRRHLSGGLAEIIKIAMVGNPTLFAQVESVGRSLLASGFAEPQVIGQALLWQSVVEMMDYLQPNLFEDQTYERLVDFGHTFSPLIEACSDFEITHGEAVAIDMALSAAVAVELGLLTCDEQTRLHNILRSIDLPLYDPVVTRELARNAVKMAERQRGGAVNLVTPTSIGSCTFLRTRDAVPAAVLDAAVGRLRRADAGVATMAFPATPAGPVYGADACLVFDVGGTHVRGGVFDPASGRLRDVNRRAAPSFLTHPDLSVDQLRDQLAVELGRMGRTLLNGVVVRHVAVAFPGPVDPDGNVMAAPTLWGTGQIGPVDLLTRLRDVWPAARIHLLNDVCAAGYRYLCDAAHDFCIVTIGSGIGQKTFIAGRPVVGELGLGGEIGHLRVDFSDDAPRCDCGGSGHLGAIASGRGSVNVARQMAAADPEGFKRSTIAARARGVAEGIDTTGIVHAYHTGDAWAQRLVNRIAAPLARVLGSIHVSTGVDRFIVYGGFAVALGEGYRRELASEAAKAVWGPAGRWNDMIELGHPDDQSGMLGAGRYATEFAR